MKKFRKVILATISIITLATVGNIAIGDEWFDGINEFGKNTTAPVDGIETIGTSETESAGSPTLLDTLQRAINWILGMLSFIALILCLRGGFQMLTAAGDDNKVKTGTKILKNAAIGLAVIGLSWLVVSFVFRIINKVSSTS